MGLLFWAQKNKLVSIALLGQPSFFRNIKSSAHLQFSTLYLAHYYCVAYPYSQNWPRSKNFKMNYNGPTCLLLPGYKENKIFRPTQKTAACAQAILFQIRCPQENYTAYLEEMGGSCRINDPLVFQAEIPLSAVKVGVWVRIWTSLALGLSLGFGF